jgi:hypothetical protein
MKPVFQQLVDHEKGDCWRCCIASILELPAEAVPNFVGEQEIKFGKMACDLAKRWLNERGLTLLECRSKPFDALNWFYLPGVYCIASVPSQRFEKTSHAVVAQWQTDPEDEYVTRFKIVHDPSPTNAPYPADIEPTGLAYIVPFRPQITIPS